MHLPLEVKTFSTSGMEDTIVSPITGQRFSFFDPASPIAGPLSPLGAESPKLGPITRRRTGLIDPASTITGLFEYAVECHPFDPAVEFENHPPTTFSALDVLAHRIASQLPDVRPGTVVPICIEASVELIASILAVLRCGAAYTVLDPSASLSRNGFIVSDVRADVVLTNHATTALFPDKARNVVQLLEQNHRPRLPWVPVQVKPSHHAYIIYTSGSTGRSKGVVISHGAASMGIRHFSTSGRGRWLLFFNPIFSAAQRTMLATLCKGACVCIASKDRLMLSLYDVILNMRIDALGVTPSMLATLRPADKPSCLKQVTTVGEPVSGGVLSAWVDVVQFRASYGLSECAQLNFSRKLRMGESPGLVGRPSDSTNVFVLLPGTTDPAAVGEVGELCLQGPQLAEGYLNRPEETAKAFVRNPFGAGRMLRTGDLAVRHADGRIQLRGRMDDQIKVNGQRMEPGETAAVLELHEDVSAAVVVLAEVQGEKALVAAVVPHEGRHWSQLAAELQTLARSALPDFMVPRFWLPYDEGRLPQNANGKINRRAIQAQAETTRPEQMLGRCDQTTPVTHPTERLVQQAWAEVLRLDPASIGREDSFFSLGGSSMQAIRMINRLWSTVGLNLGVDAIFSRQSLAELVKGAHSISTPEIEDPAPFSMLDPALQLDTEDLTDAYPATPLQESLVGLTLQGSTDYLYQRVWDVSDLNIAQLKLAFDAVFNASDVYRTTFQASKIGLIQLVKKSLPLPWAEVTSMSLDEYMRADKESGIILGQPFCRMALVNHSALVVSMHHALFDFLSSAFLYEDVATHYLGLESTSRPPFRRFVNAVTKQMDQERAAAVWGAYLENAPPTLLNFAPVSDVSVAQTLELDMAKVTAGTNAGIVFYTAWALVLSRHLDSNDVTFATPVSGREVFVEDIDRMDGPTLTVIPRRFRFNPKTTTAAGALEAAGKEAVNALEYSQFGMRSALKAAGHGAGLFDTMVNILPPRNTEAASNKHKVFRRLGEKPRWKTEYTTLQIEMQQDGRVELALSTTMEQFRAEYILEHFVKAVTWIVEQPGFVIQSLQLVTNKEIEMLLQPKSFQQDIPKLLHESFEEHARVISPCKVALQWEDDEVMTYRMLDRRANQFARLLQARGLKRGQFACLLLDKSPLMLISILAVLKVGAAYVPLSPENPVDRNAFIAEDVGATLLISENVSLQQFGNPMLEVVNVDEVDLTNKSKAAIAVNISGDDVAYVIYTSGSTGKPKGCMIQHSAAAAGIHSMAKFEGRDKGEWRALQFSNYIFDASVLDIFNTISSGGTLCMASTARLLSDAVGVVNEMGVTHSFLTPTVARLLSPQEVPSLRSLSVGGEALAADILERWAAKDNISVVMNAYGPTETAMVMIMRSMKPGDNPRILGQPLPTAQVFILERDSSDLVPYGAIGELCILGPQVGRGYVQRPDLTSAVFVDAPIESEYKMYRSGDLARFLPGGEIECFGRKDFQVKVNGHRIELGEIEQAMMATGEVADCVVAVAQIASKPQLAAFVVFDASEESTIQQPEAYADRAAALRNKLGGLAHYMYPKVLLPLGGMPKMPSGKANRKLMTEWVKTIDSQDLPRYFFDSFGTAAAGLSVVIPTETEEQHMLEQAFAEVLQLDASLLGKEANFLALGGDSIAAMNLVSTMRRLGYEMSVRTALQHPTLCAMAEHVEKVEEENADSDFTTQAVPEDIVRQIAAAGMTEDDFEHVYACPPGQAEFLTEGKKKEKMWVLMTVRPLAQDVRAWMDLVKKLTVTNDILRTTYTQDNSGKWHGVVLKGAPLKMTFIDVASEEDRARALDAIWAKDFCFGQPFIEYALLRWPSADGKEKGKQELVTKMDHGLYDGTLLRIFASHFSSLERGLPIAPHTSFHEFAAYHATNAAAKSRALQYWTSPAVRPTGFQYPLVTNTAHPNATKTVIIPRTSLILLDGLTATAAAAKVTVPIVFQAAFQLLLARRSGGGSSSSSNSDQPQDVGFDYLYTGRSVAALPDPQSVNGNCATFLPLRSAVSGGASVRAYLAETQDRFWRATENAGVSLAEVYAAAGLEKEGRRYRALFLFQPFEPARVGKAAGEKEREPMRWVYMVGSQIRMPQPYGLVCEIIRRVDGYGIKFTVDESIFSVEQVEEEVEEMWTIVERLAGSEEKALVSDVL